MYSNKPNNSEWKPAREKIVFENFLLIIFAIGTGAMTFYAMTELIAGDGFAIYAKAGVIALVAGIVSYAINRFAIEKGAPLAATGYVTAGIASVGSIAIVGLGLFASTYPGLTINSVNELELQKYGQTSSRHAGDRNEKAAQALRTLPVLKTISADLNAHVTCELEQACVSGRGGGRGPVTRALESVAGRADEISMQLQIGENKRQKILVRVSELISSYQSVLGKTDTPLKERRQSLTQIDADIDQSLSALSEAVPVSLLQAYASELQSGTKIADRPLVTAAVNELLMKHGQTLSAVLSTIETSSVPRPLFPAQAGVSSTFTYIAHFLPIAAITAVVELVLPLTLWLYTYLQIVWDKVQRDPRSKLQRNIAQAPRHPKPSHKIDSAEKTESNVTPLRSRRFRSKRRASKNQSEGS